MSLRETLQVALLLAIGTLLHLITPGYGGGMKPDLLLSMLFIVILLKPKLQPTIVAGISAGLLAALTTTLPGGQLPNIIDKFVSCLAVLAVIKLVQGRVSNYVTCAVVGAIVTLISGAVFLLSALFIVGLPAPFTALYVTVVLPAAVLNTIAMVILYPLVLFSKSTVEKATSKAS